MNQRLEIKMSQQLKQKVDAAKEYIQSKYSKMKKDQQEKIRNWNLFQEKVSDLKLTEQEKQKLRQEISHQQADLLRKKRCKITSHDFQSLAIIGKGAFGEVRLCREKRTGEIVAIKRLKKKEMVKKNQVAHIRAERNVLVHGNPWIVSLKYSFQDQIYLYLVMQFLQGGDLMTLLIKKNILSQEQARFYIMEMILAIESVHKMNYIHRDLKPDNILIDNKGHIKLSDFGLCKQAQIRKPELKRGIKQSQFIIPKPQNYLKNLVQIKKKNFKNRNRQLAYSAVGTPDYIAPQMLRQAGYTQTVDWWSIGVILYQMLVGYAPFSSDSNQQIYYKIQHHDQYLVFPSQIELSDAVVDLIQKLVCEDYQRLGRNGVQQIKSHPWFKSSSWKKITELSAPFIPELKNDTDISNFDHYDEQQSWEVQPSQNICKKDYNFIGYTFKQLDQNNQRALMVSAIEKLQRTQSSMFRKNANKQKHIYDCKEIIPAVNSITSNILNHKVPQQYTSVSKQNPPRDSFKQNSSKMLKQFLRCPQNNNKIALKQVFVNPNNSANLILNKKQTSKSPQPNQKKINPITGNGATNGFNQKPTININYNNNPKIQSPNFTALINGIKQKQKDITPRSLKAENSNRSGIEGKKTITPTNMNNLAGNNNQGKIQGGIKFRDLK